jgi:hypothetical protein
VGDESDVAGVDDDGRDGLAMEAVAALACVGDDMVPVAVVVAVDDGGPGGKLIDDDTDDIDVGERAVLMAIRWFVRQTSPKLLLQSKYRQPGRRLFALLAASCCWPASCR